MITNEELAKINSDTIDKSLNLLMKTRIVRISRATGTGISGLIGDILSSKKLDSFQRVAVLVKHKLELLQYEDLLKKSGINYTLYKNNNTASFEKVVLIIMNKISEALKAVEPKLIINTQSIDQSIKGSSDKNEIDKYLNSSVRTKVIEFDNSLKSFDFEANKVNVIVRPVINTVIINEFEESIKSLFDIEGLKWGKLQNSSRKYLITSQLLFSELLNYGDEIDYSPVILMWFKAFELELKKYLFIDLKQFLDKEYPNEEVYPQHIMKNTKMFTLGSVKYLIGEKEYRKCEEPLNAYFLKISCYNATEDIKKYLKQLVSDVDMLREKHRNKVAHTEDIALSQALDCYGVLIDVQKVFLEFLSFINGE